MKLIVESSAQVKTKNELPCNENRKELLVSDRTRIDQKGVKLRHKNL